MEAYFVFYVFKENVRALQTLAVRQGFPNNRIRGRTWPLLLGLTSSTLPNPQGFEQI